MNEESAKSGRAPDGFAGVVEAHWDAVFRLMHHLSGRSYDAEELTQETFLRALNNWGKLTPGSNVRAWLMRIGNNLFLDAKRREKRRKVASLVDNVAAASVDAGHALEVEEQSVLLKTALEKLSGVTRLVFHLRAAEEMSFREIAGIAGVSEDAARWHMHHARVKLLEQMKPKP